MHLCTKNETSSSFFHAASSEPEPVFHPPPPPITKQPSPPAPKVTEDEAPRKLPVQLRSVQRAAQPSQAKEEEREVDKIKLKKATKGVREMERGMRGGGSVERRQ